MYLDRVKIFIKAGNGGNGKTSFHTEKYVERGGPDGGDGGHGGNIVFVADRGIDSLIDFRFTKHFRAENGGNGGSNNKRGKNGEHLIIKVPCGTVIRDNETNNIIADMFDDKSELVEAHCYTEKDEEIDLKFELKEIIYQDYRYDATRDFSEMVKSREKSLSHKAVKNIISIGFDFIE